MDVIAERHLELRTAGGSVQVMVKIGRPAISASGPEWVCPYEIHFGDQVRSMAMHGEDSIQALQLTIASLDTDLQYGASKRAGTLYHLDEPFTSMLEYSGLQVRKQ